jgi:hypothetical protein
MIPIDRRFEGFAFAIPTRPVVIREFPAFVNCMVFEVVFPESEICWRVGMVAAWLLMDVRRPFASMTIWGT